MNDQKRIETKTFVLTRTTIVASFIRSVSRKMGFPPEAAHLVEVKGDDDSRAFGDDDLLFERIEAGADVRKGEGEDLSRVDVREEISFAFSRFS